MELPLTLGLQKTGLPLIVTSGKLKNLCFLIVMSGYKLVLTPILYLFFDALLYFFCHNHSLLPPLMSWRGSTFRSAAIFTSISREGCILLEHHRETVASFLPTCSASHFPVLPFSTNTTFSLLIF